jgi:uncharacterized protein (DUF924 family)
MTPHTVLDFWFIECTPKQWFTKDDAFDVLLLEKFGDTYRAIMAGETLQWRETPKGRLAEILVLDQFSRNMFRGKPESFASDALALKLAQEAIASGADEKVSRKMRHFFYMPLMHSEDWSSHKKALWLFLKSFNWSALWFEIDHARVIWKFGRYPSRNAILGRQSTLEEVEFLKSHKGW